MPTAEPIEITPAPPRRASRPRAARAGLFAAAAVVACAAACAMPFLVAAGAALGVGAMSTGAEVLGLALLGAAALAGGALWVRRHRAPASTDSPDGCGDGCDC